MILKPEPNNPCGSIQKSQDRKKQVPSNVKVLLTVVFDFSGMVHHEFCATKACAK